MERVVCYCRVSTEEEEQLNALDKQIGELQKFVDDKTDWELVGTYVDEGKSGTSVKSRQSYQELFNDLLTDNFSIIVIKDQSRLMRNVLDWYLFLDRVQKNGKKLFMYLDNQFYTPDNAFITGIKAMMAEEYSRDLSKRIKSAARRSQKSGRAIGNGNIYGYNQINSTLTINEDEAVIVRTIFELYAKGNGVQKIQNILADMGFKTPSGGIICRSVVHQILQNEKYKGTYVGHKTEKDFETKSIRVIDTSERIVIEGAVPAIVSPELWEECAVIRHERSEVYKTSQNSDSSVIASHFKGCYLLSNKMICGNCGNTMWHDHTKAYVNKNSVHSGKLGIWHCRRYRTFKKNTQNGCVPNRVNDSEIMECLKYVIEIVSDKNISKEIDKVFSALSKTIKANSSENSIVKLKRDLSSLNGKVDKLLDSYLDGLIEKGTFNKKKNELTDKIADVTKKITALESGVRIINEQETRLNEIKKALEKIKNKEVNIDDILIGEIVKYVIATTDENNKQNIEIVLDFNNTKNVTLDTARITLFETSYDFCANHCRKRKESQKVIVSVL